MLELGAGSEDIVDEQDGGALNRGPVAGPGDGSCSPRFDSRRSRAPRALRATYSTLPAPLTILPMSTRNWPCPRCAAEPRSSCRTAAGVDRMPHWRRWRLARGAAAVEDWLAQAGDFERLLHTVDIVVASGADPGMRNELRVPSVDADGRLRALHNLRALQGYVSRWLTALDSEHLDTAELVAGARRVTGDLDDAAAVLREIRAGLPVDRDALPGDRPPSVAELVAARTRGEILAAESAFVQRLASARERLPATTRWTVAVGPSRAFEALSEQGVRVRAQAVLPAAFEAELAQWSCPPSVPEVCYPDGRPSLLPAQLALTHEERQLAPSPWDPELIDLAYDDYGRGGHADLVAAGLHELRERLAPADVTAFFAERCVALNTAAAQLPDLMPDPDGLEEELHVLAGGYIWVDPATVVRTADSEAWGTIARDGERAGSVWIPNAIREWLACDDVPALLRESMIGSAPVQLRRLAGPAGPLHTSHMDGTHRLHLWRVLGLRRLYAWVEATVLPRQLTPYAVCGDDAARDAPQLTSQVWAGLHSKGILRGHLTHPGKPYTTLDLDAVPALWLLYPPALAVVYSRRYAEVYPGAWERAGIPADAFASEESWIGWAAS
ncbi:zinc finger domain-containing protein [Streptomyces lavendulocolor]